MLSVANCGGELDDGSDIPPLLDEGPVSTARYGATRYHRVEKPARTMFGPGVRDDLLVVKFQEGSRVRLVGAVLDVDASGISAVSAERLTRVGLDVGTARAELARVRAAIESVPGSQVRRLFLRPEATLDAEQLAAERASGIELADLNLFYEIVIPAEHAPLLVNSLNRSDLVEIAYPAIIPVPAAVDLSPVSTNYLPKQEYLEPAPRGIDANYAWTRPGGTGANVRVVDIEYAWNVQHEDLGAGGTNLPAATARFNGCSPSSHSHHGTAVLGELVAAKNGYGVTGICYGASYGIVGAYASGNPCTGLNVAHAVNSAVANSAVGDVILLELASSPVVTCPQTAPPPCGWSQSPGPGQPAICDDHYGSLPMEWDPAVFSAIQVATAAGRVVVEPAGNGEQNLDAVAFQNKFNRSVQDSGAIFVGAADPDTREPLCFSNYGSRLDVQGWGESVFTTGYGSWPENGSDENQFYGWFAGTSSAAPIVAGAAVDIQGNRKARSLSVLSSTAMRQWLTTTGTPQPTPVTKKIGPLPDLRRAITGEEPPANGVVTGFQHTSTKTVAFAVGSNRTLYQRIRNGSTDWQLGLIPGTSLLFPSNAHISTGMQGTTQADMFGVGTDGRVWWSRSVSGGSWTEIEELGATNVAPAGGKLATGTRNGNQLNVFLVDNNGTLVAYSVTGTGTAWSGPSTVATNFAPPGAALATGRQGTNQLDVFAIGNDGALKVTWAFDNGSWNAAFNLSNPGVAVAGAGVAVGRRGSSELDAFFVDTNGLVNRAWVTGQGLWTPALPLHTTTLAPSGAPLAVANHGSSDSTLDVFVVSTAKAVSYFRSVNTGAFSGPTAITNGTERLITSGSIGTAKRGTTLLDVYAIATGGLSVATSTSAGSYTGFTELPP